MSFLDELKIKLEEGPIDIHYEEPPFVSGNGKLHGIRVEKEEDYDYVHFNVSLNGKDYCDGEIGCIKDSIIIGGDDENRTIIALNVGWKIALKGKI